MFMNSNTIKMLYCGLNAYEYNRISMCQNAKEIWDTLEVTHEDSNQVKKLKIISSCTNTSYLKRMMLKPFLRCLLDSLIL